MSLFNLMNIGTNALGAYRGAIEQSSHNAANVGTPGYTRRRGNLQSLALGRSVPAGVRFGDPRRIVDNISAGSMREARSRASSLEGRIPTLQTLEAIVAPEDGGLAPRIGNVLDGFGRLAARAGGLEERSSLLNEAQTLVNMFHTSHAQILSMKAPLVRSAESQVAAINDISEQIADINGQLTRAESTGGEASDLRDRRANLLDELSGFVNVRALEHKNGSVSVSLESGHTLVTGTNASELIATDGNLYQRGIKSSPNSDPVKLDTERVGGRLGATFEAYNEDVTGALEDLNEVAYALAESINEIHREGYGLDGETGRNFFEIDGPLGAANTIRLADGVKGNPEGIAATADSNALPGGSDLANRIAELRDKGLDLLDGASVIEGLSGLQNLIGRELAQAEDEAASASDQEALFKNIRAATEGVSLDEEISDILRYQRGFEAAGRLVQVADEMMNTLLQMV